MFEVGNEVIPRFRSNISKPKRLGEGACSNILTELVEALPVDGDVSPGSAEIDFLTFEQIISGTVVHFIFFIFNPSTLACRKVIRYPMC